VDLIALLSPAQILLYHFLTQDSFLKMCNQIGNLLLKLDVLFDSMEKLTLERHMLHKEGDKTM
jgi:hypothetical protein